jgi:penicillin-binding protein 1A
MSEWQYALEPALSAGRRFADRHARLFAVCIALLAVPAGLLYLAPVALGTFAPPVDLSVKMSADRPAAFTFLDASGQVIGHRGPVLGRRVTLDELPAYLPAAFIAMEDRRFYAHNGVDFLGIARASLTNARENKIVAGGSTISQQTAKIMFYSHERTVGRKVRELLKAVELENSLSKKQILELYLNRIYLGGGAYGVDTAARTYFGVSARDVTLQQAAMLAALTRAPSVFSPRRDLAAAQQRAGRVLAAMVETGAITPGQAAQARAHPASVLARRPDTRSYFLDTAAEQALEMTRDMDVASSGLIVHTTLKPALQQTAERTAAEAVRKSGRKLNFHQVAVAVLTPDGAVSAMVGGIDYKASVFNRATQAHRQPGSAFKPFVYLAALQAGLSPWEWREDRPVDIAGYQPANYQDAHYGRLRLTDALARSVNTVTVNLAQEVGVAHVLAAARRAGITSPLQANASLALGTNEVTPLELTAAYCAFANGGKAVSPYLVTRIDAAATGTVLYQREPAAGQPAFADSVRRDLVAMLHNVVTSGTGTAARLGAREAAGKTGTTQGYRDGWFVGFTVDHVAGVWVGNDDNAAMRGVTGGSVPAQIWKTVMTAAEAGRPVKPLDRTPVPAMDTDDAFAEEPFIDAQQVAFEDQGFYAGSGAPYRRGEDWGPAAAYQPEAPSRSAPEPMNDVPFGAPIPEDQVDPPVARMTYRSYWQAAGSE